MHRFIFLVLLCAQILKCWGTTDLQTNPVNLICLILNKFVYYQGGHETWKFKKKRERDNLGKNNLEFSTKIMKKRGFFLI